MGHQKFNAKKIMNSVCTKSEGIDGKPYFPPGSREFRVLGVLNGTKAEFERMAGVLENQAPAHSYHIKVAANMLWGCEKWAYAAGVESRHFTQELKCMVELAYRTLYVIHQTEGKTPESREKVSMVLIAYAGRSDHPGLPTAIIRFFAQLGQEREKEGDLDGKIWMGERIADVMDIAESRREIDPGWNEVMREGYRALDKLGLEMEIA